MFALSSHIRFVVRDWTLAALTVFCTTAGAACLDNTDPRLSAIERLTTTQPVIAEQTIEKRLASHESTDPEFRAKLYAALADVYALQEKHTETGVAVREGLSLTRDPQSDTYINLLYLDATRPAGEAELAGNIARAEAELKRQPSGSQAEACMLITLGLLEHFADRPDQASVYLTRAYRMSTGAARERQRMLAATVMSMIMQVLRDYPAALALNQEVIGWLERRGDEPELSTAYFMRGYILSELRDHAAALAVLQRSRALSVKIGDPIGIAYSDLLICTNKIGLGQIREARTLCESALRTFEAEKIDDPLKQALLGLAEIDLREAHPDASLEKLNRVLAQDARDLVPLRVAHAYELRSRAHRALKQYQQALDDYENYMQRFKASKEDERAREASASRARFQTDLEVERNDFLRRELESKNERLAAQSARLHWMIIATLAGLSGIVFLTLLLIANRKKKRLLSRLATEDELTGLPNRRYTLQRATIAFEAVRKHDAPLTIGILDIDHFKRINDQFGHAAGDFVLREFARIARDNVRKSDLLGRWGGEEFLLVMPNTALDVALVALDRIRRATASIQGGPLPPDFRVTMSAGLANDNGRAAGLEDLIAEADGALYEAKHRGRNRVQIAQDSFDASATSVRRSLRHAGIELSTGKFTASSESKPVIAPS